MTDTHKDEIIRGLVERCNLLEAGNLAYAQQVADLLGRVPPPQSPTDAELLDFLAHTHSTLTRCNLRWRVSVRGRPPSYLTERDTPRAAVAAALALYTEEHARG